jgi:hypothetical protein
MLAADGRCKTLDAAADGYARGEGCGVLQLQGDSGQANTGACLLVLLGSAVNQDGRSSSLTAPNGPSQQRVVRAALQASGATADAVDGLQLHGTGTGLGDPDRDGRGLRRVLRGRGRSTAAAGAGRRQDVLGAHGARGGRAWAAGCDGGAGCRCCTCSAAPEAAERARAKPDGARRRHGAADGAHQRASAGRRGHGRELVCVPGHQRSRWCWANRPLRARLRPGQRRCGSGSACGSPLRRMRCWSWRLLLQARWLCKRGWARARLAHSWDHRVAGRALMPAGVLLGAGCCAGAGRDGGCAGRSVRRSHSCAPAASGARCCRRSSGGMHDFELLGLAGSVVAGSAQHGPYCAPAR